MRPTRTVSFGSRVGIFAAVSALSFATAFGAAPLFPRALHLVRRIEDPLASRVSVVDEYCSGNRIVTIGGGRVVITDYDAQQVTEIDHAAGTFSITRFDEIAQARAKAPHPERRLQTSSNALGTAPAWKVTPMGSKPSAAGRAVDAYELDAPGNAQHLDVGIDRRVTLSREAVEALVGASYPNDRGDTVDSVVRAAASHTLARAGNGTDAQPAPDAVYGLPSDQTLTVTTDGQKLVYRNAVIRVDDAQAPTELMVVPPGAKRVESPLTRTAHELEELDRAPSATTPR